jgi:hypothetical protein
VSKKKLLLCLDGVPYQTVEQLRGQGVFRLFQPPSRCIAPFPSMTNVGMKELLDTDSPAGYEGLYFDRAANGLSSGVRHYLRQRKKSHHVTTYHRLVDYQEPVYFEFLVYAMPQQVFLADFNQFLAKFESSDAPVFVGYLKSTDGLIHLGGQEKLDWALRLLDEALTDLFEKRQGDMEIVLFSDHGNNMLGGQRLRLKDHLRRAGFKVGSQLEGDRSIVIPEFGLVTFAAIYTTAEPALVGRVSSQLEGVEFALHREDETVVVTSNAGQGRVIKSAGQKYRYEPVDADPLGLNTVLKQLGQLDAQGIAGDREWFEATAHHALPDILHRVSQAMGDQVKYRADVLLSLVDGFYAGNAVFDGLVELVATHGSARASCSTGILMSSHQRFPLYVRASDVPGYFGLSANLPEAD